MIKRDYITYALVQTILLLLIYYEGSSNINMFQKRIRDISYNQQIKIKNNILKFVNEFYKEKNDQ
jgi:hypothetical protein